MSGSHRTERPPLYHRIAVVGTTGSGKTTLAERISSRWGLPHVELDALHWGPGWTEVPVERFREQTAAALSGESWVVDGNYREVRDIVWGRADTIVWLDYPVWLILARLAWRTCRRVFSHTELWGGNRESFRTQFFTQDSLFLWAWHTYPIRRQEYPLLLAQPQHAHLTAVRLRSPREAQRWQKGIGRKG
jgi:adenylate kinase family enzyme